MKEVSQLSKTDAPVGDGAGSKEKGTAESREGTLVGGNKDENSLAQDNSPGEASCQDIQHPADTGSGCKDESDRREKNESEGNY